MRRGGSFTAWWRLRLTALLLALASPGAWALVCSASVDDIDFGMPVLSTTNADALATLTVTCTGIPLLTAIKICPSLGEGSGGSAGAARLLAGPGGALRYQLYQDTSRSLPWGAHEDTSLGTVPPIILQPTFTGAATATRTIYARLFGSQSEATPGRYGSTFGGPEANFRYTAFLFGASGGCTGFVGAASMHPEFTVSVNPVPACGVSTSDLGFGSTGVITRAINGQTTLRVTCTSQTRYSISLDNGRTGTAPTNRLLTSSSQGTVTYGLYQDAARTRPWGAAAAGQGVAGVGTGGPQDYVVHGQVPLQRTPRPGVYSDRVTVTLTY